MRFQYCNKANNQLSDLTQNMIAYKKIIKLFNGIIQLIFAIRLKMAISLVDLDSSSLTNEGRVKIFDANPGVWSFLIQTTDKSLKLRAVN